MLNHKLKLIHFIMLKQANQQENSINKLCMKEIIKKKFRNMEQKKY